MVNSWHGAAQAYQRSFAGQCAGAVPGVLAAAGPLADSAARPAPSGHHQRTVAASHHHLRGHRAARTAMRAAYNQASRHYLHNGTLRFEVTGIIAHATR
jgi:hypothetical protein